MKFSGKIGFWAEDTETKPGVYRNKIQEKTYKGDVLKNIRRFQTAENQQNENLRITNRLSIVSDLYMKNNWPSIKYVKWNGIKWSVSSVDISSYPRAILELGGVYNGETSIT